MTSNNGHGRNANGNGEALGLVIETKGLMSAKPSPRPTRCARQPT